MTFLNSKSELRTPEVRTGNCLECHVAMKQEKSTDGFTLWLPVLCGDCSARNEAAAAERDRVERETELRRRISASGVPPAIVHALPMIDPTGRSRELRDRVDDLISGKAAHRWLVIAGSKGSGKSTEAARAIVERGGRGVFVGFSELLLEIRESYKANSGTSEIAILRRYRETPLLVLDDIGSNRPSSHAADTLYNVLNYRYDRGSKTILTTNLTVKELAAHVAADGDAVLAERIIDRVREMSLWFDISISSYRKNGSAAGRDWTWADKPDLTLINAGIRTVV